MTLAVGLWYPVSALIVSGTRSRWLRFGLFCLMFWAGYAALVLHSSTWAETRQLDAIFPFYKWRIRLFSADEFQYARQLITSVAV